MLPGFLGELTVIVPVAKSQVGWIISNEGADGLTFTLTITPSLCMPLQPLVYKRLTVYIPDVDAAYVFALAPAMAKPFLYHW